MRVPLAFREQVHKIGTKILAGDADRVIGADLLERWVFKNALPLAHAVVRDWVRDKLSDWLRDRLREEADRKVRPPAEEALFDILDQMPEQIEIGVGRFIDRLDATRSQLLTWQRQAHVKRDNVVDYGVRVDRVVACLLPRLTTDEMTVREALLEMQPVARGA